MYFTLNDHLAYEILSAVAEIPFGKVATYGQIARLIGRDRNARLIGRDKNARLVGSQRSLSSKL